MKIFDRTQQNLGSNFSIGQNNQTLIKVDSIVKNISSKKAKLKIGYERGWPDLYEFLLWTYTNFIKFEIQKYMRGLILSRQRILLGSLKTTGLKKSHFFLQKNRFLPDQNSNFFRSVKFLARWQLADNSWQLDYNSLNFNSPKLQLAELHLVEK